MWMLKKKLFLNLNIFKTTLFDILSHAWALKLPWLKRSICFARNPKKKEIMSKSSSGCWSSLNPCEDAPIHASCQKLKSSRTLGAIELSVFFLTKVLWVPFLKEKILCNNERRPLDFDQFCGFESLANFPNFEPNFPEFAIIN